MPGRGRLKAVLWLLFAALCQVTSPAQAAFMGMPGFVCPPMAAAEQDAAGPSAEMAAMDMGGMGMSAMAGMGHSHAPSDDDRQGPAQCTFECCNGGLIAHAALVTPHFSFTGPGPRTFGRADFRAFAEAPHGVRPHLRPAIRAPPAAL